MYYLHIVVNTTKMSQNNRIAKTNIKALNEILSKLCFMAQILLLLTMSQLNECIDMCIDLL